MKKQFDLSAAALHILAMAFMLLDHLWATLFLSQEWMTCVGRLAFPIFAFMAVEGYFHTHSFKKYAQRMLIFALLSEIPFDLMYGGTWFYPVHQNVIWTLLIGLLGIRAMEAVREKGKTWLYLLTCVAVTVLGFALGTLGMVDYYGMGVLTALAARPAACPVRTALRSPSRAKSWQFSALRPALPTSRSALARWLSPTPTTTSPSPRTT